jgi:hypothetical protein
MTSAPNSRKQAVAAQVLGLELGASADRVRGEFLSRVEAAGLVPLALHRAAAAELGLLMRGPAQDAALRAAVEEQCGQEIEAFAERYWEYPPGERRAKWVALREGVSRHPRLCARLQSLSSGLDLSPVTNNLDAEEQPLAAMIVELYPLKPTDRTRRQLRRMAEFGTRDKLRDAARSLSRRDAEFGRIDHNLLETLVIGRPPALPLRVVHKPQARPEREPERTSGGSNTRWGWVIAFVCVSVCSGLAKMGRNTNDSNSPSRYASSSSYDQAADRNRLAKDWKAPPDTFDQIAKILDERRVVKVGLTPGQQQILNRLARMPGLSPEQARELAKAFLKENPVQASGLRDGADPAAVDAPAPMFTSEQIKIRDTLAYTADLSEERVRDLLIQFVKTGNQPSGDRPPP